MPPKAKPAAPPAVQRIPSGVAGHIIVTSAREGFRRAGRAWSKTPTTVAVADLGDAALTALEAEPMLRVERVTAAAAPVAG